MTRHLLMGVMVVCLAAPSAYAQTEGPVPQPPMTTGTAPSAESRTWRMTVSFANVVDGNVNHSSAPVRSYGAVPSLEIRHERPNGAGWGWSYEVAAHSYTGTDEWDRFSHNVEAFAGRRLTKRLRAETSVQANWNGSSDDRELANTFGVVQRATYRLTAGTRLSVSGAYRYKVYGKDPGTSGLSPYIGAKVEQLFGGDLRLTAGYRHQTRRSQSVRDRYRRDTYVVTVARPLGRGGRLALDVELRSQRYERLIKVAGRQVPRLDHRGVVALDYARPLGGRSEVRWIWGLESRRSTDPSKGFVDPTFAMTVGYRLR